MVSYAQERNALGDNTHTGWKKRVLRSIHVAGDTAAKGKWVTFFTSLADFALKGKIVAYKGPDLSRKMSMKALKEQIATQYDTVLITDPVTNEEKKKIVTTEFDYTTIEHVIVCEEWSFDPQSKKTTIHITGVAPGQEIYSDAGVYKRTDKLFWIKWEDFQKYANDYQDLDATYDLGVRIWKDYLKDETILSDGGAADMDLEKETVWKAKLIRKTHLYPDTVLSYEPNLARGYDSSVIQLLFYAAIAGRISVYSDQEYELGSKLNRDELEEISKAPADTVNIGNPVTGADNDLRTSDPYDFDQIRNYCVHERWKYSYSTGVTEINYSNIAPMRDNRGDDGKITASSILYWFNYADAEILLKQYNGYNIATIEFQLWQDRFREKKHDVKTR